MGMLRTELLNDYEMPSGRPESWDAVTEVKAHYLAQEFSREYLVDFDGERALHRLGCYDSDSKQLAKELLKHPLVTHYTAETMRDFCARKDINDGSILSMLWMEANDHSFGSSSRSRVAAMKEIIKLRQDLGISEVKQHRESNAADDKAMPPLVVTIRTKPLAA